MAVIQFVRNMDDLSTDRGYQFKFYCDKCGNGYLSSFQTSYVGTAGGLLRAAGTMLGGNWTGSASGGAYELQRAIGGPAHDAALNHAVQEGKVHFHQCTRCGRWVCPEACWNSQANMCDGCAPKLAEEMASAQAQAKAQAARQQLFERAQHTDYASNIDMSTESVLSAPKSSGWETPKPAGQYCTNCGADMGTAKFCPECGTAAKAAAKPGCSNCGATVPSGTKFCPECGNHLSR
ncbi:MAG: zinc ribbon domain-containing protein [Acidobacteriaceae bacterium]|nr:zinc ribbon domain-containing protein [Acidobacteriaceae bacterium]